MSKTIRINIFIVIFSFLSTICISVDFNYIDRTELKLENNEIFLVGSIAVNDHNIFITDRKAANIKILNLEGSLVKIVGRKGYGPSEFQQPFTSFIKGNTYYVLDFSLERLNYFDVKKDNLLLNKHLHFGKNFTSDIKFLTKNKFLVAGHFSIDGFYLSLAEFDLTKEEFSKKVFYAKQWMGVNTKKQVEDKMISTYRFLSYDGYVEVTKNHYFFTPGSHLNIFRINKKTNTIMKFGKDSPRFIEPELPLKELERSSRSRNHNLWLNSIQKRSFVLDTLLIDNKFLIIVFSYYNKKSKNIDLYYHSYDMEGKFLQEKLLLHSKSSYYEQIAFYYNKKNNNYYILSSFDEKDESIVSQLYRFKVRN